MRIMASFASEAEAKAYVERKGEDSVNYKIVHEGYRVNVYYKNYRPLARYEDYKEGMRDEHY